MEYDGFVKLFKYSPQKLTPLENYMTEAFVFLLNYLKSINNKMVYEILDLFGILRGKQINISSQTKIQDKKHIPDICIETGNIISIVEVKVNSNLNKYKYKGRNINQYELYSREYANANIFLLTKHLVFENNIPDKNKVLWVQIFQILEESDDYFVKSFLYFLEENGMASVKLDESILTAIRSIIQWKSLIEDSWRYGDNFSLSPIALNMQGDEYWIRYFVKDKKRKQKILYIGIISSEPENLYVYLARRDLKQYKDLYGKKNKADETLLDFYNLKKLFLMEGDQQKSEIEKFFKKIMEDKLKI
jgi:hypothetical protein